MFNKNETTKIIQYPLYFTVKKPRISRKGTYDVYDEDGNKVYKIKRDGILNSISVFNSAGTKMFTVKEKGTLNNRYVFCRNKKEIGYIKRSINPAKPFTLFYEDWAIDKYSVMKGSTRVLKNNVPIAFIEMEEFQKEFIVNYNDPNYDLDSLMIFTGIYFSQFFYDSRE